MLLLSLGGFSAFGQLVGYPDAINNGTVLLNGGIGFGGALHSKMNVPPFNASIDWALPIAAMPFTVGLELALSSEKDTSTTNYVTINRSSTNFGFAFRLAYHIRWQRLEKLDTYALLAMGDILAMETVSSSNSGEEDILDEIHHVFWFRLGAGARYFFLPRFGAFAELTFGKLYNISFGVSFKL